MGQSQGHSKKIWDPVSPKWLEVSQSHLMSRSESGLGSGSISRSL